jgi:heme-degrading monooxygenase HmoA
MIVRIWNGRASLSNQLAYPAHFRSKVLPLLHSIDGFLGTSLLRREKAEGVEFLVLTRWASMDAVRSFAGSDIGRAIVEPEAKAALDSFDTEVQHYDVVEEAPALNLS